MAIQVGARTDINVVNKPLAKTTFQLVATPRFLNRHGAPEKPSDLKHLRCVMFTEYGVSKPWKFVRGDEEVSVTPLCRWRSNNGHCLLAAALRHRRLSLRRHAEPPAARRRRESGRAAASRTRRRRWRCATRPLRCWGSDATRNRRNRSTAPGWGEPGWCRAARR